MRLPNELRDEIEHELLRLGAVRRRLVELGEEYLKEQKHIIR